MAANEPNIKKWFKEYTEVLEKLHIESTEYIWSGDETGVQTVPKEELYLGGVNKPLYSIVSAVCAPHWSYTKDRGCRPTGLPACHTLLS